MYHQELTQRQAWPSKGMLAHFTAACETTSTQQLIFLQKLQRAIAESRGQTNTLPLPVALNQSTPVDGIYRSDDSAPEGRARQRDVPVAGAATSAKRKYRRHPRVSSLSVLSTP
jgi:hypothetical protein